MIATPEERRQSAEVARQIVHDGRPDVPDDVRAAVNTMLRVIAEMGEDLRVLTSLEFSPAAQDAVIQRYRKARAGVTS